MTKSIPLSHGKFALVDDDDFERVSKYKWHYDKVTGYARACVNGKWLFLHRFIMGAVTGEIIDHKDTNKLICKKDNLRFCTKRQNHMNTKKPTTNTSGYKGVSWDKVRNKFTSQIKVNQKHIFLGRFEEAKDAARCYNEAAKKYFGDFANINKDI